MPEMVENAEQFLSLIRQNSEAPWGDQYFLNASEIIVARAPGRLDLMGGIADYSGSLVLQWPIREATWVALQRRPPREIHVVSLGGDDGGRDAAVRMPLTSLEDEQGEPITYAEARVQMSLLGARAAWAAYVLGVFLVLMRECDLRFDQGARLAIASDVPEGKGVSSSAAIEVATMRAVAAAYGVELSGRELAILCQVLENQVVGAPCGVMDQMASACGESDSLLALLCRPAELMGSIALPEGLSVWGIDSGVRHSVSGADYGTVRTATFMGLTMIERSGRIDLDGCLTRLTPSQFVQHYAPNLPEALSGGDFTAEFGNVADPLSCVHADRIYPVRSAAAHPIYEHFRVQAFAELLKNGSASESVSTLLGELMYQSHASYSAVGLGSSATDRLTEIVREIGPSAGLFGAKITGGGSGGTVAILGRSNADDAIAEVVKRCSEETGREPYVFTGSSAGAAFYPVERISWA